MKIIRVNSTAIVIMNNGNSLQRDLTEEEFNRLITLSNENDIISIMSPAHQEILEQQKNTEELIININSSNILTKRGDSIYWEDVSELSMPPELVKAILKAESNNDEDKLEAYKNFWTLMSLNPDSKCRQNLFWFLNKWGMTISRYGLFVGYRNVDIYRRAEDNKFKFTKEHIDFIISNYERIKHNKKSPKNYVVTKDNEGGLHVIKPDSKKDIHDLGSVNTLYQYFKERNFDLDLINPNTETVYTDNYTHTFRIKIGELVTMPREECNTDSDQECQSGLHIAGQEWLNQNYFGNTGLICLVNPAKVVAVPHNSQYGKLRTCEYLPIGTVKYNEFGKIIPYNLEDGFNSEYVKEVLYSGNKANEEDAVYKLEIPEIPELNKNKITQNVIDIANKAIQNRVQ